MSDPIPDDELVPHHRSVFVNLAWLLAIVALLVWLRQTTADIQRDRRPLNRSVQTLQNSPTVEFATILSRSSSVRPLVTSVDKVAALFGKPTQWVKWGTEFAESEGRAMFLILRLGVESHDRIWAKWVDPDDKGRCVAVLIVNGSIYSEVSSISKDM